jgi:hypothetical protein
MIKLNINEAIWGLMMSDFPIYSAFLKHKVIGNKKRPMSRNRVEIHHMPHIDKFVWALVFGTLDRTNPPPKG